MLSNGEAHRPLVHCRDIASAFHALCEAPKENIMNLVVNFGPKDANPKVIEMAKETKNAMTGCSISVGDQAGKDSRLCG